MPAKASFEKCKCFSPESPHAGSPPRFPSDIPAFNSNNGLFTSLLLEAAFSFVWYTGTGKISKHEMKKSLLLNFAALFPPFAYAQATTTVSLLLLDEDAGTLVASVVRANPTSTVYLVNCEASIFCLPSNGEFEGRSCSKTDTDENDCGTQNEWLTQGRDFFAMNMTAGDLTATWSCNVQGTTSASCFESSGGAAANFPGTTRTMLNASEITICPVRVTAGVEKLSGSGAAGSTTVVPTSSGSGRSSTSVSSSSASSSRASGAPASSQSSASASASDTVSAAGRASGSGSASSSSTGAAARETGPPVLMAMAAIGGAVVLI